MKTLEGKEIINAAIATLNTVEADANNALPERIHLLRTGKFPTAKYGNLEITATDLQEMVDNFAKGYGRPGQSGSGDLPINFGHDKGGKAAGWITELQADDDGNLWGKVDWTGSGKESLSAKDYQYISSEFTPRCLGGVWASAEGLIKGIRNVFTGAALTNIPMFNGNKGIMASAASDEAGDDKQVIYINATEKEQQMPTLDEVRVKDADKLTDEDKKILADNVSELSADEKTKFNIEATADDEKEPTVPVSIEAAATSEGVVSVNAADIKELVEKNAELTKKIEAADDEKSDLQKTVDSHAEMLKASRRKDIEASVDTHIARGAIVADQKSVWADKIEADASNADLLEKLPSNKSVEAENIGAEGSNEAVDAAAEVDTKAKKLMADDKELAYHDAVSQVMASDSELAARYNKETV